ncbi:MAG TPA: hypothetical protein VG963_06660 [Polyangiaceae bacterium]|nr:hypothetical protein [Polyangiaceae bacterium]
MIPILTPVEPDALRGALHHGPLVARISDGGFERHVRRARRAYAERRQAALETLARAAARVALEFQAPDGGLAIWTRWPEHSTLELARRGLSRGVSTLPSNVASLSGADHGMRLAFGRVAPAVFAEGVDRLVEEALALRPRHRSKASMPP